MQERITKKGAVSEETGRPVQKPYSGNLMLRVSPEVHAAVATTAEAKGKSLNQWASEVLGNSFSNLINFGSTALALLMVGA